MTSRIITRGFVFLLLGAIVNVAVAWGCSIGVSAIDHGSGVQGWVADQNLPDGRHWMLMRRDAFGSTRIGAMTRSGTATGISDESALFPPWCDLREAMRRRVEEGRALNLPSTARPPAFPVSLVADARGWPMRALECSWDYGTTRTPPPAGKPLQSGIELPPRRAQPAGAIHTDDQRALPVQIIWPGFAINTIFYATILWLLVAAPFALRRRRRIRRGLCPRCAYDLRGGAHVVCPECGAKLHSAVAAAC